jgi:hypothetical protein
MYSIVFLLRPFLWSALRWLLLAVASTAPAINLTVDPASSALTNYTSLGEWDTDGNFESWMTAQLPGATVTNGAISGVASASDPQFSRLSIVSGPDLDSGFNDIVDLRLQVTAGFSGNVLLYYGSTNTTGISAVRVVTINTTNLVNDGAFHVYRIDMGLEGPWRGNLTDLRVELSNAAGAEVLIDYLRVGDLAGDIYYSRSTVNCPAAGGTDPDGLAVANLELKHFRFMWAWDL